MDRVFTTASFSDEAYQLIKQQVVTLKMPPGSVIDERSLRKELGIGRTPIREALTRLALEQLVAIVPRRGTFVTNIDVKDLHRIFEVRVLLEGLAARYASDRATDVQIARMEEAVTLCEDGNGDPDNQFRVRGDQVFHELVYEASDNRFLKDILVTLYALSLRVWYALSLQSTDEMHTAQKHNRWVLDAIKERNPARAEMVMCQHVREFVDRVGASITAV